MGVSLCEGEYSHIHSVFNQWIKLSICSTIDVSYDNCLSTLTRPRDTRGFSIIHQLKLVLRGRGGGGETYESQVLDSCRMFNYSTATVQAEEEESITVQTAHVLTLCESWTWSFPCSGSQSIRIYSCRSAASDQQQSLTI